MTRKPKIWFDYQYLASLDDPDAPREAFFLDEPAQQVLSQLAEMVLWETRWFNGDPDDSHTLAHSIYEQLKMPLHFDDLIPYLDDVENLLQAILDHSDNSVIVDQLCCDNGVIAPLPDETGQDVVRDVGDPPNGIVDWPTYDVHLCSSAQQFVDSLPGYIDILQALSILTTVGLAAAIAGLASGLAAAGIAATAVLGIQGALSYLQSVRDLIQIGPSWDNARTALEDSQTKQDLVCAIVQSDTAQEAENAIDAYLNSINSDAASSIRTLPLRFLMGQIFGAQADAGGYGGPCDCTTPALFTWDLSSGLHGWVSNNPDVSLVYNGSGVECNPNTANGTRLSNNPENGNTLASRFGLTTSILIDRVEFDVHFILGSGSPIGFQVRVGLIGQDDQTRYTDWALSSVIGYGPTATINTTLSTPALLRNNLVTAVISSFRDSSAANGQRAVITAIRCYGTQGN